MAFVALVIFLIATFRIVFQLITGETFQIFGEATTYVDAILFYMAQGLDIVWLFIPRKIAVICMGFSIAGYYLKWVYQFIMWVIRKVPFISVR